MMKNKTRRVNFKLLQSVFLASLGFYCEVHRCEVHRCEVHYCEVHQLMN